MGFSSFEMGGREGEGIQPLALLPRCQLSWQDETSPLGSVRALPGVQWALSPWLSLLETSTFQGQQHTCAQEGPAWAARLAQRTLQGGRGSTARVRGCGATALLRQQGKAPLPAGPAAPGCLPIPAADELC